MAFANVDEAGISWADTEVRIKTRSGSPAASSRAGAAKEAYRDQNPRQRQEEAREIPGAGALFEPLEEDRLRLLGRDTSSGNVAQCVENRGEIAPRRVGGGDNHRHGHADHEPKHAAIGRMREAPGGAHQDQPENQDGPHAPSAFQEKLRHHFLRRTQRGSAGGVTKKEIGAFTTRLGHVVWGGAFHGTMTLVDHAAPLEADRGEDSALVAALRRRDGHAFDELYRRYHAPIWRFLARLAGPQIAEDLFQDTWLSIARHAAALADDTDLRAWLFTVARNRYRSHRRWAFIDRARRDWLGHEPRPVPSGPERLALARDEAAHLEKALSEIDPAHREVLLLIVVEGMSTERAAAVLELRTEAVRKRLSRARAALAERLNREEKGR